MAVPDVYPRLKIDADTTEANEFVLDTSVIGTDALASSPSYVYVDDDHILSLSIRRGGRRWQYDTGEVVVTLDNRSGDYNPDDHTSMYAFNGKNLIRGGMLAQVALRYNDTAEATAFTGRLSDARVTHDPIMPTVTLVFEDALAEMGATPISDGGGAEDQSLQISGDLLAQYGYQTWPPYAAATGQVVVRPSGGTLRNALQEINNADMGRFYVDTDGTPQIDVWSDETAKPTAMSFSTGDTVPWSQSLDVTSGLGSTYAGVKVEWANGDPVQRQSSQHEDHVFGMRVLTVRTALAGAGDAEDLAQQLADIYGRNVAKVDSLGVDPCAWGDSAAADTARGDVAGLEIGDVVNVDLLEGATVQATVERIDWDFAPGRCRLRLGLEGYQYGGYGNADWFVVGSSALDGTDVLAY